MDTNEHRLHLWLPSCPPTNLRVGSFALRSRFPKTLRRKAELNIGEFFAKITATAAEPIPLV
jgi:hypothetical protein